MIPKGIVFINNDLTESTRKALFTQLYITDYYDGYTFDSIIAANPDFPTFVKNNNMRIAVVRSFFEHDNRDLADVVIFVTHGTASILKNKFGPPSSTYRVAELTWQKLCVFDMSIFKCSGCGCEKKCCKCKRTSTTIAKSKCCNKCNKNRCNCF